MEKPRWEDQQKREAQTVGKSEERKSDSEKTCLMRCYWTASVADDRGSHGLDSFAVIRLYHCGAWSVSCGEDEL